MVAIYMRRIESVILSRVNFYAGRFEIFCRIAQVSSVALKGHDVAV